MPKHDLCLRHFDFIVSETKGLVEFIDNFH
jgi:hypothetical protein